MGHSFTVQQPFCESSMQSTLSTSSAMANAGVVGESRLFLRCFRLSADYNDIHESLLYDFASPEAADNETLNSKRLKPHCCAFSCATLKF